MAEESTSVILKKKNIQPLVDYCLENELEFSVKPRTIKDEYELEFNITSIKKAIALGMCLRELKITLKGMEQAAIALTELKNNSKKPAATKENGTVVKEEPSTPLAFDTAGGLPFTLETGN
jgi:hypothetical protein